MLDFPGGFLRILTLSTLLITPTIQASPLYEAVVKGEPEQVQEMLTQGYYVNEATEAGLTPLHYAAASGNAEIVEILIAKGADVDARDTRQVTPLFFAAQQGHAETLVLLIDSGADVNAQHQHGATSLHAAAIQGNTEITRILLKSGADPHITNESNETPLMLAVTNGNREITLLIANSSNELSEQVFRSGETLSYRQLRQRFNGQHVGSGRIWSREDSTISSVHFPGGKQTAGPSKVSPPVIDGAWSMGTLLFLGAAKIGPAGVTMTKDTVMYYQKQSVAQRPVPEKSGHGQSYSETSGNYQIQIAAGSNKAGALKEKAAAENMLSNKQVSVVEESSLYKVRVGAFETQGEALRMLDSVRQKGYPNAWVVVGNQGF